MGSIPAEGTINISIVIEPQGKGRFQNSVNEQKTEQIVFRIVLRHLVRGVYFLIVFESVAHIYLHKINLKMKIHNILWFTHNNHAYVVVLLLFCIILIELYESQL